MTESLIVLERPMNLYIVEKMIPMCKLMDFIARMIRNALRIGKYAMAQERLPIQR